MYVPSGADKRCRPVPPAKPARLRDIPNGSKRLIQRSFPPAVPPKPSLPVTITVSEHSTSKLDNFGCEQSMSNLTADNRCDDVTIPMTATGNEQEDNSRIQNDLNELSNELTTTKIRLKGRAASFTGDEIRKPRIKPPPPPPSVQHIDEKHSACTIGTYSRSSTPTGISNTVNTGGNTSRNHQPSVQRYHRQIFRSVEDIPSVPSIPPPLPPLTSPSGSVSDDVYEEIEHLDYTQPLDLEHSVIDLDQWRTNNTISECSNDELNASGSKLSSDFDEGKCSERKDLSESCSCFEQSDNDCRPQFRSQYNKYKKGDTSANMRMKMITVKRPKSALEFDRLLRIKSDIQLNITKKVGQIKLKVSSASQEKQQRQKRLSSTFYVNPAELKTDNAAVLANFEFPLDEQCIYGDDWSSDEDTPSGSIAQETISETDRKQKRDTSPPQSMLSEIEKELRLKFTSNNLPDVVLESKRRSLSAEPLSLDDDDGIEIVRNVFTDPDSSDPLQCSSNFDADQSDSDIRESNCEVVKQQTLDGYDILETTELEEASNNQHCFPSSSSDYTLKEIDRSIYTPRIIPDPQPLYQIYMLEHSNTLVYDHEQNANIDEFSDGGGNYKIQRAPSIASTDSGRGADSSTTISQITSSMSMRRDRLVAGSDFGSQRSLWCELPEVKNSGLLDQLDDDMKKLQEAYFEVITSEASYLRSLNILITHFMAAPELLGRFNS